MTELPETSFEDKIKLMDLSCKLCGYPWKKKDVEQLVLIYEAVCNLGEDMNLMDVAKIKATVEQKYSIKK